MDLITSWRDFHFLRPAWLLALPLLWLLSLWLARRRARETGWSGLIDEHLLPALRLAEADGHRGGGPWPWLALAWTLAVLALAGPSWQHEASAAYRAPDAWVLVLDLSPSMTAADVQPNRATRARYAIDDLLGAAGDARVGLIAFGDEPYTVTPLTDDVATVRSLLQPLAPDIMPTAGDRLGPALDEAGRLLERSASQGGQVVVLTDGFADPAAALAAASRLRSRGATLSVVGIGTPHGAPYREANGQFALDARGATRLAPVDADLLKHVAATGGGRYVDLGQLPRLIERLQLEEVGDAIVAGNLQTNRWRDAGAWLLPLLLLLTAVFARRGWL